LGVHYFAKLVDATTGEDVLSVFIRSGRTVNVKVPLGRYKLKYATGRIWYGRNRLFGFMTAHAVANRTFAFSQSGNRTSGYVIELIRQSGGNLATQPISPAEW
jgi:hypothetical protein